MVGKGLGLWGGARAPLGRGGGGQVPEAQGPRGQPSTLSWQVEKLLEQSAPWQERRTLSLPPGLLGGNWGPELSAWALLEACGLELQVDTPQVRWEPEAQGCTCALYASLALLSELSQLC